MGRFFMGAVKTGGVEMPEGKGYKGQSIVNKPRVKGKMFGIHSTSGKKSRTNSNTTGGGHKRKGDR